MRRYLLLQSHDCVNSEVSALTGVGDAHRAGQEEPSSQHLKAAPAGGRVEEQRSEEDSASPQRHRNQARTKNKPVGHIQGQGLPGRVVHHGRVTLKQDGHQHH